jgi:hypothetical protein
MSKLPLHQSEDNVRGETNQHEHIADAVGASVINVLGHPVNLFRVSIVRLWKDHYRVNVQTRHDTLSVLISHSFFIHADDQGNIVKSNPTLTRVY